LFLVALAVFIAVAAAIGTPVAARASSTAVIATDVLNLRAEPSTSSTIINQMVQGESVSVLDGPTDDGWYYVSYYGEHGYAYGGYLDIDGEIGWASSSSDSGVGSDSSPEHWIDVNRSTQTVTLYVGDEAVASYWASLGYDSSDDGFYSTAIGTYHVFSMNESLTWTDWGKVYIEDWVGFDPVRDNGFHSFSMDADGNVLPNGDGPTGGCVATAPSAAEAIYDFATMGMRVEVHW
jgi:hypothetical protein